MRLRRLLSALVALSIPMLLVGAAGIYLFFNYAGFDRLVYDTPLRGVPEPVKETLRPWRAPRVAQVSPAPGTVDVSPRQPIAIEFSTPMDQDTVERNVHITPEVQGTFQWSGNTLLFVPTDPWPLNTRVAVNVDRGVRSWAERSGDAKMDWEFSTLSPTQIDSSYPPETARYFFQADSIVIRFSRAMDRASVEERLTVTPTNLEIDRVWSGSALTLKPKRYQMAQPGTQVSVALAPGAKDSQYGMALSDAHAWQFTITTQRPSVTLADLGRFAVLSAYDEPAVTLQHVNVGSVRLSIHRLDPATYLKATSFTYDDWRKFKASELPKLDEVNLAFTPVRDQVARDTVQLPKLEPGLYMLVAQTPEGSQDGQVLVVGRSAAALKRSQDQVLAWVTDMQDGHAVAGLNLQVFNQKGESIARGVSDAQGLFVASIPETKGTVQVLSDGGGDMVAVSADWNTGVEPWRYENVTYRWDAQERPERYRISLYTDRPIYRPGQTVNFKAIIREDHDAAYSVPPEGTEVSVSVQVQADTNVYHDTLRTSATGTINGSFTLNSEARTGYYNLQLRVGDEEFSQGLQVEEYRKPTYEVTVAADKTSYVNGDTMRVSGSAQYYFGGPVTGAQFTYHVFTTDYWYPWSEADEDFQPLGGIPKYYGYGTEIVNGKGTTDAAGHYTFTLPADIQRYERSQVFTIEVDVTDASNLPVAGTTMLVVHRGDFYIGGRPTSWVVRQGEAGTFDLKTMDVSGKPRANVALSYTLVSREWKRVQVLRNNRTVTEWQPQDQAVKQGAITSGAQGTAKVDFVPAKSGSYVLNLEGKDARGNRVIESVYMYVSGSGTVSWRGDDSDRIEIVPDKRSYAPGETARLLIQSPYEKAAALVTIERGSILEHRIVNLDSGSATVDIPITGNYFPNVYASAVVIPQGAPPSFKVGLVNLPVKAPGHTLNIKVAADREAYRPGDTATYTITTTNDAGQPVAAEVSLAVVDASVLALTEDTTRDIVATFWGTRPLAVVTAHSLAVFAERTNQTTDYGGGGGGGGPDVRSVFVDTANWTPVVQTDAAGRAKVTVTMPDSLTTWRAVVRGVTRDTLVGAQTLDVKVNKDLFVNPALPRFLTIGDTVLVDALVHNTTAAPLDVEVTLAANGLTLGQPGPQRVMVPANGAAKVSWPATVQKGAEATVLFSATSGALRDSVEMKLPVLPFGARNEFVIAGAVPDALTHTVDVPVGITAGQLRVELSPSLAAGLIPGLGYLTGYPYGCIEQTMSRFLPDVLVWRALRQLGIKDAQLESELPKMVEDGLQRVYSAENYDGGWGWWYGDQGNARLTAYVVYGLIEAKQAGFAVDDKVLDKGALALRDPLAQTTDLNLKTYVLYVLTRYGQGDLALARSLLARADQLDIYSRAYLVLTLDMLGSKDEAVALLKSIEGQVIQNDVTAYWKEAKVDYTAMSSNTRTTALVLEALIDVDPTSPLVPKTVRWLMEARQGGYWRSTQETASVIVALTRYLTESKELESDVTYEVKFDGNTVAQGHVAGADAMKPVEVSIPLADLRAGLHQLTITRTGTGVLYYSLAEETYKPMKAVAAARSENGPQLKREYLDPVTGKPVNRVKAGDLIQVQLTLTQDPGQNLSYIIIEDPLPAGTEAVNESLNTTAVAGTRREYFWAHPEFRDDKTAFFVTYADAKWPRTFRYMLRATNSGTFQVMPARVYQMYEPQVWAQTSSYGLIVEP